MALAVEQATLPMEHPDSGGLLPFPTEADAVEYTVRRLSPYCYDLKQEVRIGNGLRPDLVIRLSALPDIQFPIELKQFTQNGIAPFPEAVRQAASYGKAMRTTGFVGPLAGRGSSDFNWFCSSIGTGLLIAGQFCVGGLYFAHDRYRDEPTGGLLLAGVNIARFTREYGKPKTYLHSNAEHLLKFKFGKGSQSWRQ